jgi:hypothetical protein
LQTPSSLSYPHVCHARSFISAISGVCVFPSH